MSFYLRKPTVDDEKMIIDYLHEWDEEKMVPGSMRLFDMTYQEWLLFTLNQEKKETCKEGNVPATFYLFMENEEIIGAVHIRHFLNDYLLFVGGHIGYGIRPSKRGKGKAREMLKLACIAARELGIDDILVTADDDNPASYKTIESCGGMKENAVLDQGHYVYRYWIKK